MSKEMLEAFRILEEDKGIKKEDIIEAVTESLRSAYRRRYGQFYSQPCFGHKVIRNIHCFLPCFIHILNGQNILFKTYQIPLKDLLLFNSLVQADIDVLANSSLECFLGFQWSLQARTGNLLEVLFWKWVWFDLIQ